VGVGQDEVDIVRLADVSVVTLVPGAGDDVQALKAGIMEIADVFVVNKADREGADRMVSSIEAMLSLQTLPEGGWPTPVLKTEATRGIGVPELLATLDRFRDASRPLVAERRSTRVRAQLRDQVTGLFLQRLDASVPADDIDAIADRIASRTLDPRSAAGQLLARVCPAHDR
jgi:LAO/AO transport system kinase